MTRQRLSAVVLSFLLVVSAATAAVPASALTPNGDLATVGNETGGTSGNDATTTLTTTTVANDETTTISETTTETTTATTTGTDTGTENRSGPSARQSDPKVSSALLDEVDSAASGPNADTTDGTEFVQVVVRSSPGRSDTVAGLVGNNGGEVQARHGNLVQARLPAAAVTSLANSPAVEFARQPRKPDTDEIVSEGLSNMDVSNVHDAGVTGENVTVAVVDVGFNVSNPEISDQLTDWRNFSSPGSPNTMQNESGLHGTGTAELVADTAPNASIIAVSVGSEVELYEAIDWIEQNTSADVVTMSLGWYNVGPLDGTAQMNREINDSVQNGTTWFTSAGNEGRENHWNGTWSGDENRWLNFSGTDEAMNVTPVGGSGTLSIAISWNDWGGSDENYDAYLYNASGDIVAGSTTVQNGTQDPTEYIYEYVDEPVYLRIYNRSANGSASFDFFFNGNSEPEYWTSARSLTVPATGPEVVTVGAAHYSDNELESFSSRGPTIDGRRKPDVVAPDGVSSSAYPNGFYGTSAAAPHTAGVAALMLDANRSLGPAEVETRLESSAVPLRDTEPNNQTGYGLVDADGAIASVEEEFPDRVTYSGSLTEADGDTAVDDDVSVYALDSNQNHESSTDTAGNYSISAAGINDSYALGYYQGDLDNRDADFMARDGSPDLQALDIVNGTNSSDLGHVTLPKAHVLNVTVVDETGARVSNAEVEITDFVHEGDQHAYVSYTTVANADGELVVAGNDGIEAVGDVRVRVGPPDGTTRFAGSNYSAVIDVQNDTNVTLTLESAGASVSGQVADAAGNASSDDLVFVSSDVTGDAETTYTNATGDFTVTGIETGAPYTVGYYQDWNETTAFSQDGTADIYALDRVNVTGDTDLGRFEVPNASVLNVRVLDENNETVSNANISVNHHRGNATTGLGQVSTDSQGWINPGEGRGIEMTGNVTVEVTPPDSELFVNRTYTRNLTITGDRNVTVHLEEDAVEFNGSLREADGDLALNDDIVARQRAGEDEFATTTGTDGNFSMMVEEANLSYALGYYQGDRDNRSAEFMPRDGSPDLYTFDLANGTNATDVGTVTLPNASVLNVTVVDESGDPVPNVTVYVGHTRSEGSIGHGVGLYSTTDAKGRLALGDAPGVELAGDVTARVYAPDSNRFVDDMYTRNLYDFTSDENLTITLQEKVNVSGQIDEADGTPSSDDLLAATSDTADEFPTANSDSGGNFSLTGLAAGEWYSINYYQSYGSDSATFPRDGSPDVYVLDTVNVTEDMDLGHRDLPNASVLNIRVVDESGDPVKGADAAVIHRRLGAKAGFAGFETDSAGYAMVYDRRGVEMTGNVTVEARPPENSTRFVNETTVKNVTVTSDRNVTVTLTEKRVNFTAQLNESDGTAAAGDTVGFKQLPNSPGTRGYTNATGGFTVELQPDERYQLEYYQDDLSNDSDLAFPDDGSPDLYALGRYDPSETRNISKTLPEAHDLNVTVETVSGTPIENASVKIRHHGEGDAIAMHGVPTNADGMMEPPTSDGPGFEVTGEIDVIIKPPENSSYRANKTSLNVTSATNLTMVLRESVNISGYITESDGDPAADDFIFVPAEGVTGQGITTTDADGNFSTTVSESTGTYDVQYYQGNFTQKKNETFMPRDGSPDLYSVAAVDASNSTDLGSANLPNASVLNVTVVNESDVPVQNASVRVRHTRNGATTAIANIATDEQGRMKLTRPSLEPGIEVTGNVTIEVSPPENATRYRNETYARNFTVTNDTAVTVTLAEKDLIPPNVTDFGFESTGQNLDLEIHSDERLANVTVELSEKVSGTLTREDFTLRENNTTYVYTTNISDTYDGHFGATLVHAKDAAGNDGASNQTAETVVDTHAPSLNVTVTDATDGDGVVNDSDEVRIEATAADELTGVANVTANATALGAGFVNLTHEVNDTYVTTVTVSDGVNGTHPITAVATDAAGNRNISNDSIVVDNAAPNISYFAVYSGSLETSLTIEIHSKEQLKNHKVNLKDADGNTVTFTNLTESSRHGGYEYVIDYGVNKDGTYHATLVNATDAAGNQLTSEPTNETVVDTTPPGISNLSMTNDGEFVTVSFDANETLNTSAVVVEVTNESGVSMRTLDSFSESGSTYTDQISVSEGVNETWTAELMRAEDDHGLDGASNQTTSAFIDTVDPSVSGFNATTADGNITVTFQSDEELATDDTMVDLFVGDSTYADQALVTAVGNRTYETTFEIEGAVERNYTVELNTATDEAGNAIYPDANETVWVDTVAPSVEGVNVTAQDQNVNVRVRTDEKLGTLAVELGGDASGTLTYGDFQESENADGYLYFADVSDGQDGTFSANVTDVADDDGNVGTAGQNSSLVVETTAPSVGNFSLEKSGQDVDLSFTSNESLGQVTVNLTGDAGGSLALADFTETTENGVYVYTANVSEGRDGTFEAQLTHVEDEYGNAPNVAALSMITVDTTAPTVSNFSATNPANRTIRVAFDSNESLADISVGISGPESATLTEADFDSNAGTYVGTYNVSSDGEYTVTLESAADSYGNDGSTGQNDSVVVDDSPPTVTNLSAYMLDNGSIATNFESNETLANVSVVISGPDGTTLTEGDFSRTDAGVYSATYAPAADGEYTVTVETATDAHGNDGADGQNETVVVDTVAPEISNFTATNSTDRTVVVSFDSNESLLFPELDAPGLTVVDNATNETGGVYTYRWTLEADADGWYTVALAEAADAHGNDGAANQSDSLVVDTRAPNTTATLFGNETDSGFASDVTVSLSASDEVTGVNETWYRVDSGNWTRYEGNVTVSGDGDHVVEFYSADAANNTEAVRNRTFTIDTHAPNSSVSLSGTAGDSGWYVSAVEANVTAEDGATGIDRIEYRVDGGDWLTYDGTVAVSDDGNHTFEYRAIDAVGHREAANATSFRIDATDPATESLTNTSANDRGWYDSDVTVRLSADDADSGVNATYYRRDGGNWTRYDGNITFTTDGEHTVEFYSDDRAGNEETPRERTVKIDTQKPGVNGTPGLNRTKEILPEHAIEVVVDAHDGQGVADVTVDGVSVERDGNGSVPASPRLGNHTFEVVVTDLAGNQYNVTSAEYSVGTTAEMKQTNNSTLSAETNDTNVNEVTIDPENETGNASVKVGTATSNPTNSEVENGTSLYFPQINTSVSNDNIENASVTLTVERSRVRQKYVVPGTVKFWVQNETTGEWAKVDAERVGETDDTYTYEIEAPHFSTYAVTGDTESVAPDITEFGTQNDSLVAGDVTISASYGDDYSGIDPANVTLTLDGTDVTSAASVTAEDLALTRNLSAGTYNATLSVSDNASNVESEQITFTVANRSTDDGSGDSGGNDGSGDGGNDGGNSGGGGGGGGAPPPAVQVSVVELTETSFRGKVVNARSGDPGNIEPESGIEAGDLTVEGVTVTPKSADSEPRFFVDAAVSESAPDGASALDATELGYLDVSTTYISSSSLSAVGVEFSVSADAVAAPENVALYRLENGSWAQVETTVVGERDGRYVLRATAADTGTFAVGAQGGDLSVTDASVSTEQVEAGGTVEVTATVENVGDGTGTATVEVRVDSELVVQKQVTVPAGESETVSVEVTLDAPGTHDIAVDGVSAGSVSVVDETTTASGGDDSGDDGETGDDAGDDSGSSGGIPGFGLSATLVALLAGLLVARRLD